MSGRTEHRAARSARARILLEEKHPMDNVVNLNVKQKVHGPLQQALKTAKAAVKAPVV